MSLPADVLAWVEEVAGGPITRADRVPGGARREAWLVDVRGSGGGVAELFLRYDPADPEETGDPWTLQREGTVFLALQGSAVPVPRVLGVHPLRQVILAERVVGGTWFSLITDPAEQLETARDFVQHLAALHLIDPASLDLPGFPKPTSIPDLVHHELDELEAVLVQRGGEVDAGLRLTLDWLRAHIPEHTGPIVLVQGDTGPGNFLYADGRVTAVVDWELAHLGDPMDDIAWLSLRAAQERFTHLPDRLREYEARSGHEIDDDRVRYYRVMAEAKLLVMGHGVDLLGDLGNQLIFGILHERLWLEAMVDVLGLDPQPPARPPTREPDAADRLATEVLAQLREVVVPGVADPFVRQRAKGLARGIKYLAARSRDGAFCDTAELDDAETLLRQRPATLADARAAVDAAACAGTITAAQYFEHRWRRAHRENELRRSASGVLADRHWPELR